MKHLLSESEIFIVQRGGVGTLAELFLLLDEERKLKVKPFIFLIGEQWETLFDNLSDFITIEQLSRLIFCSDFVEFKQLYNDNKNI